MNKKLLEQAQKLIADDEGDESRRLLLEAGSGPEADSRARGFYEDLFPLTPHQREWMAKTLMNLIAKAPAARGKAAKELCRAATREMSYQQQQEVGDPRCLDYIIPALKSGDAKVAECAVVAIAKAALFYYRDWRAWESVTGLLKAKTPNTRRWAVQAAANLAREQAVDAILPLLTDKVESVRSEVGRMLISMAREGVLSSNMRKQLASTLAEALPGHETITRQKLAGVVREMNVPAGIQPLRAALKRESDPTVREYIAHAIRCLETKDPSLPL